METVHEITIQSEKLKQAYQALEIMKQNLKERKAELKNILEMDAKWAGLQQQIEDLKKEQQKIKEDIAPVELQTKIKALAEEVKLEKSNLSGHAKEYVEVTGLKTISIQETLFDLTPVYELKKTNG